MLKKNHFLSIEETGSHSPLFNIKQTNLELSLALSSPINNRKELFSTLPPNSDRNCSVENKIKHILHLKKKNHKRGDISLPKIDYKIKNYSIRRSDNDIVKSPSFSQLFPSLSFETKKLNGDPVKFHKDVIKQANNEFKNRIKVIKQEILDQKKNAKEEEEKKIEENSNNIENQLKALERYNFVKSYNKNTIDETVIKILENEMNQSKTKQEQDKRKKYHSRNRFLKPLYLKQIDPVKFISKKHPMLEINQLGTIPHMFQDGQLMGSLLQDNFDFINTKKHQIIL